MTIPVAAQFYGTGLLKRATLRVFSLVLIGIADRVVLLLWRGSKAEPIFTALDSLLLSV
jgi:hypothetical protein